MGYDFLVRLLHPHKTMFFFGVYWRGRRIVKTSLSGLLHSHKTMFEECVNCWGMSGSYFFITFAFLAQHVGMCLQLGGEWVTTSSHRIAFLPTCFSVSIYSAMCSILFFMLWSEI
jgi:hypothetical protein